MVVVVVVAAAAAAAGALHVVALTTPTAVGCCVDVSCGREGSGSHYNEPVTPYTQIKPKIKPSVSQSGFFICEINSKIVSFN